ncbi:MAG: hypothetical protein FWC59_02190, partial [Actinomycetia bacterium]|nr:hypothetical protein [Actinomycetes bacterium]
GAGTAIFLAVRPVASARPRSDFQLPPAPVRGAALIIVLVGVSIIVRAVVGAYTPIPWRSQPGLYLLPALAVFIGKFAGGLLADRLGARRVAVVSLALAAPLLALANDNVLLCCLGLMLFNIITAVTLVLIAAQLPENPGFAFGLTTLGLFLGSSLSFFWAMSATLRPWWTIGLCALSIVCVLLTCGRRDFATMKKSG